MMNIDDALRIMPDEIRGQDLHIAGQHNEVDLAFLQKLQFVPLGLAFIFLGDRNHVIGNAVEFRVTLSIGMIADNERDFTGQFRNTLPVQQVYQAVVMLRNKDRYSRPVGRERNPPLHGKLLCNGRERCGEVLQRKPEATQIPFDSC